FTKGNVYNKNGTKIRDEIEVNNSRTNGIGRFDNKFAGSSGVAYVPTANKIIFRRNSEYCWDNLHIEFFKDADGNQPVGEQFPGYLMEPYAYADSAYRIHFNYSERYETDDGKKFGNLCYEITIPKEARYFRINNGTKQAGSNAYNGYGKLYTQITQIADIANRKNGGNYWKLKVPEYHSGDTNRLNWQKTDVELETWTYDEIVNKAQDDYWDNGNSFTVESDNDFIFFKKPSYWKNTVYAYFYGGGDLRADNWQRAVYSIWPGLIPAGSKVKRDPTTGAYFNTDIQNMELRVDSTYQDKDGNTIYKFRMPLGDDTNYKKVMFSDGLIGSGTALNTGGGGGHESKVHDVEGGKGYTSNGSWTQTSAAGTTETYTFRKTSSQTDYIYIVNNNANPWGDIHIKFYDGNGNRVGQGGNGYVMQYAGKWTAAEALANLTSNPTNGLTDAEKQALANTAVGDYYRVPVPANAVKFALDNGNSSYNKNRYTGKYDIQPDHIQVYAIQGNVSGQSLQPVSPLTTVKRVQNGNDTQTNDTDYTVRTHVKGSDTVNDYLYLQNDGASNFASTKIIFYDTNGVVITGTNNNGGEYTPTKMDDTQWLRKEIPLNAVAFRLKSEGTDARHDIYPQGTSGTQRNFTDGDMIYGVANSNALTLIYPAADNYNEVLPAGYSSVETPTDTNYEWRDFLDLVVSDNTDWSKMRVTFYKEDGTTEIASKVIGQYRGELTQSDEAHPLVQGTNTTEPLAVGHWYRFGIPMDAAKFMVYNVNDSDQVTKSSDQQYDILPLRTSMATRKQNYTLGGMQYRIADTPKDGTSYELTRFYPVFTETEEPTNPFSEGTPQEETFGQTADSINKANGAPLTRYTDVEPYASLPVAETPSFTGNTPADMPVLYATDSDTITYEWTESNYYDYLRFVPSGWWKNSDNMPIRAHFSGGTTETAWLGIEMFNTGETWTNGNPVYAVKIPSGNNTKVTFTVKNYEGDLVKYKSNDCVFPSSDPQRTNGNGLVYVMGNINDSGQQTVTRDTVYDTHTSGIVVSADDKIRFNNSQGWTAPITATFTVGGTAQPPVTMDAESENIYSCDVP
ncbi:MAG: hypothetical protein VZR73_10615, partial [Acutalibacteraceae bacterium]|nr:hypothetical protein [Acutalibacteraceae bacterium]